MGYFDTKVNILFVIKGNILFIFKTETWEHLTDIPDNCYRHEHKLCCVEDKIYLVGEMYSVMSVSEYNPRSKTWRLDLSSRVARYDYLDVCTLDNKIFKLCNNRMNVFDMSDDDPQWTLIPGMSSGHFRGVPVVLERKIYVVGGNTTSVEVYDVDQGT